MSETLWLAVIGGVVAIIGSILGYMATKLSSDRARLTQVETRASQVEAQAKRAERINQGMWIWNRSLQDQIYKRAEPPPLEPPEWLKTLLDD